MVDMRPQASSGPLSGSAHGQAQKSYLRLVAPMGIAIALPVVLMGFFTEAAQDPERVRYMAALRRIESLTNALERFDSDCGRYPSTTEGLAALVTNPGVRGWRGPYLNKVPADSWHRPFLYSTPHVQSLGADGRPGGEFFNADLSDQTVIRHVPESPYEKRANRIMLLAWLAAWLTLIGSVYALVSPPRLAI